MFLISLTLLSKINVSNKLRDIFRVHPDTPSNTHDLLECICEGDEEIDGSVEQVDPNDDQDDDPQGFMLASQVKPQRGLNKTDKEVKLPRLHAFNLVNELA